MYGDGTARIDSDVPVPTTAAYEQSRHRSTTPGTSLSLRIIKIDDRGRRNRFIRIALAP
jgi:hypothetical protein